MAAFHTSPLPGGPAFGATVTGLDADAIDDPAVADALRALWIDKGVILFRGVAGLDAQLRLSALFGAPEEHPLLVGVDQKRTHHVIADIEYDEEEGDIYEIGGEPRGGFLPWHFDLAYLDRINRGGILRPHVLPRQGGETGFIDRIRAWETLPADLKAAIEGLSVVHAFSVDSTTAKFGERPDACLRLSPRIVRAAQHPVLQKRAIHPLVYAQPETGRKVLNVSPWHAEGIVGREGAPAADALLHAVIDHMIGSEAPYLHQWREGDMVLWDNWRMLHSARGVPPGEARKMGRTTIAGDYALGRWEEEPVAATV
jgi:taurine dioxygenase